MRKWRDPAIAGLALAYAVFLIYGIGMGFAYGYYCAAFGVFCR